MFGNNKPFGQASTFGTSTFGANPSPFGQTNTFGAKPATGNVFGGTTFGAAQPQSTGLFGTQPAQTGTGLFGQPSAGFGQPASTSGGSFVFGSTPTTGGGLFGATAPATQQNAGLFGGSTSSAFGTPRPTFGGFGGTSSGTGLFGQNTTASSGLFSSTSGFTTTTTNGTTVKFHPPTGSDTMMKGGVSQSISTRNQCITCMKEYENKSLEELRLEDYSANRKGPQAGSTMGGFGAPTQTGLFGATAASTPAFSFGTTQAKPLFGTTTGTNTFGGTGTGMFGQTAQQQTTGLFGKPGGFGVPTTTSSGFSFGATSGTSMFGQNNQQKPLFGQPTAATGLFGQPATTQTASTGFGMGSAFGGFGTTSQPSTGIFGAKQTGFGTTNTTTTNTFSFGQSAPGGSLFGPKPAAPVFGTSTFGGTTTPFGGFGTTAGTTTGLFGQTKPNTLGFGMTGSTFGGGLSTGFGSTPFSSTGLSTNTGLGTNTGLFGSSLTNKTSGFGFGFGTTTPGFGGFGQSTAPGTSFGFGTTPGIGNVNDPNMASSLQQQIQAKHIFAFTSNPFGDNPLFRNSLRDTKNKEDLLKPTNPAAQKAVLTINQYKVSPLPAAKTKPKPITPIPNGKVSLFDGLEDEEPSLGIETFVPKRSFKKLVLKPPNSQNLSNLSLTVTSDVSSSQRNGDINVSTSVQLGKFSSASPLGDRSPPSPLTIEVTDRNMEEATSPQRQIDAPQSSSPLHNSPYVMSAPGIGFNPSPSTSPNNTIKDLYTRTDKSHALSRRMDNDTNGQLSNWDFSHLNSSDSSLMQEECASDGNSEKRVSNTSPSTRPNDTIKGLYTQNVKSRAFSLKNNNTSGQLSDWDFSHLTSPDSSITQEEGASDDNSEKCHPTGIRLYKHGYYTQPLLDELTELIDSNGNCYVENFTVGRKGYGKVCFPGTTNVANLNLDEIVHFRRKEITVYPAEEQTPPIGEGLNRKAEITLECVWPMDKTTHSPIKDPDRLLTMGYREKIEKSTSRLGAKFIDYRPESGSWIFEVEHFSKYALEDSDDENDNPLATVPKTLEPQKKLPTSVNGKEPVPPVSNGKIQKESRIASRHDEDDEMQDADKIPNSEMFFSPLQQFVTTEVGTERIQGMKMSFFRDEEEEAWGNDMDVQDSVPQFTPKTIASYVKPIPVKKPIVDNFRQYAKKNYGFFQNASSYSTFPSSGDASDTGKPKIILPPYLKMPPALSMSSSASTMSPHELMAAAPHKTVAPKVRRLNLKPVADSLLKNKEKFIADMGFFMNRTSRVGWGANMIMVHPSYVSGDDQTDLAKSASLSYLGNFSAPSHVPTLATNSITVSMSKIQPLSNTKIDDITKANLNKSLMIQLQHSVSTIEEGSPIFVPRPGVETLHAHAKLTEMQLADLDPSHADRLFIKQCHHVWTLCVALWGNLSIAESDESTSSYAQQIARREALSKWLIETNKEKVQSEINNNSFAPNGYLNTIFTHLTVRQVSKAVHIAQDNHDHGMSKLLSQVEGTMFVRRLIGKQLTYWKESEAYKMINSERLKLYSLMAGMLFWICNSTNSTQIINCCENLDWRRALALHLWYCCYPTSSIENAVIAYDTSFTDPDPTCRYASPPYPPYVKNRADNSTEPVSKSKTALFDTCYHLLKLYCDRSYRLDKLLMPEMSTPAHLDFRLSWFLHQALNAIEYTHMPANAASMLHLNFASQLEAMGLWQWAIFVVLHLPNANQRENCVKDLLLRYLPVDSTDSHEEIEIFLQERLTVPQDWIFEAKAIRAHSFRNYADEAWYLLKAGSYSKSHEVIIGHLASEAIINENYDYLLNYLNELAPVERSSTIHDWPNGGQVFLDYIHVSQMVESVIKGEVSAYDVEKLQPEVVSLCNRLSSLYCPTAKDKLCQSEMAKKTATLLRAVLSLQEAKTGSSSSVYTLAPHIKNLPMPEDYAIQELRALARNYLLAVTSE